MDDRAYGISLRNIIGQEVIAEQVVLNGVQEYQVDLSIVDKGVYFLTVKGETSEQAFKILVQ
jgi:hypothetical protein